MLRAFISSRSFVSGLESEFFAGLEILHSVVHEDHLGLVLAQVVREYPALALESVHLLIVEHGHLMRVPDVRAYLSIPSETQETLNFI